MTLARQFLENFCEQWNTSVRTDHRPTFAAFFGDVEEDVEAIDWPNRLRDRLGLSHYNVLGDRTPPKPVALLRYRVKEVLAAGSDQDGASFAVPTVLDGELNTHFFPAPREVLYGRSLDLNPDPECERLVAEVLHRRIEYRPEHILKVGKITSPLPPFQTGTAFARLRNGHRFCLRYESGREDFGENIPEGEHG